jgi:hypothetical protein
MGVEYRHFLIPENPSFVPSSGVIKRIDAVLEKWKLKAGAPTIYNLTANSHSVVEAPLHTLILGQGLGIKYPYLSDGNALTQVMGPDHYGDNLRYFYNLVFVVGIDFRIHSGDQSFDIKVIKPPYEGATPLEPYWEYDDLFTHMEAYHSTLSTTAPEVEAKPFLKNQVMDPKFKGYWRTALVIECGKSLPDMPEEGDYKIPNKEFIKDVEDALGCQIIQTGSIH